MHTLLPCPICGLKTCSIFRRYPNDPREIAVIMHGNPLAGLPMYNRDDPNEIMALAEQTAVEVKRVSQTTARIQSPATPAQPSLLGQQDPILVPAYDEIGDPAENSLLRDGYQLVLPSNLEVGTIIALEASFGKIYLEVIPPPKIATHRLGQPGVFIRRLMTGPLFERAKNGEVALFEIARKHIIRLQREYAS